MKLFLTALCASFMIIPTAFSEDCDKGKCDKEKKEEGTVIAESDKCKKEGDCDKEKKDDAEGTMIAEGDKCKKDGDCDKEKKEEGTLADCGKCKKDGDKEKKEDDKEEKAELA